MPKHEIDWDKHIIEGEKKYEDKLLRHSIIAALIWGIPMFWLLFFSDMSVDSKNVFAILWVVFGFGSIAGIVIFKKYRDRI